MLEFGIQNAINEAHTRGIGSMMLSALPTSPALIDQVHDRLLAAVIDGTLMPGERLTQDADGYVATVCNGVVIAENDRPTGDRGGRVLRSN